MGEFWTTESGSKFNDVLHRGPWLASDPFVAGLGSWLLALVRRNERSGPSEAGGMVPHARRDVRVLVDPEASTELSILSPQSLDLPGPLPRLTLQLPESLLGNDDPIALTLRGRTQRCQNCGHGSLAPKERKQSDFQFAQEGNRYPRAVKLPGKLNTYESIISRLLMRMGYARNEEDILQLHGKPGDQGIDGKVQRSPWGWSKCTCRQSDGRIPCP